MPRNPAYNELSDFEKGRLIGMIEMCNNLSIVSQRLSRDRKTVRYWWNHYLQHGNCTRQKGRGRKSKFDTRTDRVLCKAIKDYVTKPYSVIRSENVSLQHVCLSTVIKRAVQLGFRSYKGLVKPVLTTAHKATRLQWCNERLQWSNEWHNIVFSDESRFCLSMSDGRIRFHRKATDIPTPDTSIREIDKFQGGSVMIWGAISYTHLSRLIVIEGRLNARRYIDEILLPEVIPFVNNVPNAVFQHDNAPPHRSTLTREFLEDEGVVVLPWPAKSPDLSIIEDHKDHIDRQLTTKYLTIPTSLQTLKQRLQDQWNSIPITLVQSLYDSLPRRVAQCANNDGGHTTY